MNYYELIKQELINNEIYKRVKDYSKNRSDLKTYYNVGKMLVEAQGGKTRAKYGNKLIKEYSDKLTKEVGKGYTTTNLRYMRQFYLFNEKCHTMCDKLTWSHYRELLWCNDINKINYYFDIAEKQSISVRELHNRIKSNEYERLDDKTKLKLIKNDEKKIEDFIKNPIIIKSKINKESITEKILHQLILENIVDFMNELGEGFSFVDSEYKIKIGNNYNYIDLLLFNYIYNSFVVVELKITELKKEYMGQIKLYMNYIDKRIKKTNQNETIGIIICKKDNEFVMEYCSDERIFKTTYQLV